MIACMEMRPQHRHRKPAAPVVIAPLAITLTTPPVATNTNRPAAGRFETEIETRGNHHESTSSGLRATRRADNVRREFRRAVPAR
jgi:hypothetical protein